MAILPKLCGAKWWLKAIMGVRSIVGTQALAADQPTLRVKYSIALPGRKAAQMILENEFVGFD